MSPKQAYRLQRKLQAALVRVVDVLSELTAARLRPNLESVERIATVMDMLLHATVGPNDGTLPMGADAFERWVQGIMRRRKESIKRQERGKR
jgi:hypothetical protein